MEVAWCADRGLPHSTLLAWDSVDRAKLQAHLLESGQRCQSCGTSPWEWEDDRHAYEAGVHQCWGCYVKDAAKDDQPAPAGTTVVLVPRKVAEARRAAGQRAE
jgi:hypothetical protein